MSYLTTATIHRQVGREMQAVLREHKKLGMRALWSKVRARIPKAERDACKRALKDAARHLLEQIPDESSGEKQYRLKPAFRAAV